MFRDFRGGCVWTSSNKRHTKYIAVSTWCCLWTSIGFYQYYGLAFGTMSFFLYLGKEASLTHLLFRWVALMSLCTQFWQLEILAETKVVSSTKSWLSFVFLGGGFTSRCNLLNPNPLMWWHTCCKQQGLSSDANSYPSKSNQMTSSDF